MDDFKVDIRLPREGDADPSRVVVSGDEDAVLDCIDHLKIMVEMGVMGNTSIMWEGKMDKEDNLKTHSTDGTDVSDEDTHDDRVW